MIRVVSILIIAFGLVISNFSQDKNHKSIEELISDLTGNDRELSDIASDELTKLGEKSAVMLLSIAADKSGDEFVRVRAINILGRIKYENSVPVLINILNEQNSYIKGSAAYTLSQIGGEDVQNALLEFLKVSFEKDYESLPRAVEAIKELPDKRVFPILMEILDTFQKQSLIKDLDEDDVIVNERTLRYAIEALGNIGDSRASVEIAKFLSPDIYYVESLDYLYLEAIHKSGGKKVIPQLVSYLEATVKKLEGKVMPLESIGAGNRQINYDFWMYKKTIDILESITGQKSVGSTRRDIAMFWKQYSDVHNLGY